MCQDAQLGLLTCGFSCGFTGTEPDALWPSHMFSVAKHMLSSFPHCGKWLRQRNRILLTCCLLGTCSSFSRHLSGLYFLAIYSYQIMCIKGFYVFAFLSTFFTILHALHQSPGVKWHCIWKNLFSLLACSVFQEISAKPQCPCLIILSYSSKNKSLWMS